MGSLPAPTLSFTIPSQQDDLKLECRVYHPKCLAPTSASHVTAWERKAAIVAHPYATLGGCMDDPVVGLIASTCLKEGFVVGMFNFRGAGCSEGRTSWQGKGEQNDYKSFIAFMAYYLHHLSPPHLSTSASEQPIFDSPKQSFHDLSPVPSQAIPVAHFHHNEKHDLPTLTIEPCSTPTGEATPQPQPLLLLAGYSYGALITASLPPILGSILSSYQHASPDSTYASIRKRAHSLATQQNTAISNTIHSLLQTCSPSSYTSIQQRGRSLNCSDTLSVSSPKVRSAVRMGGDEDLRRASHESQRHSHYHHDRRSFSMDTSTAAVRKSIDRVRSMGRASPKRQMSRGSAAPAPHPPPSSLLRKDHDKEAHEPSSSATPAPLDQKDDTLQPAPNIETAFRTAYLLVSPLHGLVSNLVTFWHVSRAHRDDKRGPRNVDKKLSDDETKLTIDPTLAVFGDSDVFVSVKRLRAWAERLGRGGDKFRYVEVQGAGHFWQEKEYVDVLRNEVRGFLKGL